MFFQINLKNAENFYVTFLFCFLIGKLNANVLVRPRNFSLDASETNKYTVLNNPSTISMDEVRETMAKAFDAWSTVYTILVAEEILFADYDCQKHCNNEVINISFVPGKHGDSFFDLPFDETEAGHAIRYFIHFNNDIKWRKYNVGEKVDNVSTDFYTIALFTVGQFFGLDSSDDETSVMYRGYRDSVDTYGNYIEPTFSESDFETKDKIWFRDK